MKMKAKHYHRSLGPDLICISALLLVKGENVSELRLIIVFTLKNVLG